MYFVGNESMNTHQGILLNSKQNDYLESADVLFSSILNLLSGKAVVSCEINNGSLVCKIHCSDNFPTLTVFFDKCGRKHRNSMPTFELSAPYSGRTIYSESRESNSQCSRAVKKMGRGDKELLLENGNNFHVNNRENKIQKSNILHSDVTSNVKTITSKNSCKSNLSLSKCTLNKQNDVTTKKKNLLICRYCEKIFLYQSHRIIHERKHTGEKPYSCDYCDRTFASKSSKTAHERIHTGEKPYCCRHCDKKFAKSGNKIAHERLHEADKLYNCRYCQKRFPICSIKMEHEMSCPRRLFYSCRYCKRFFHTLTAKMAHRPCHCESVNLIKK